MSSTCSRGLLSLYRIGYIGKLQLHICSKLSMSTSTNKPIENAMKSKLSQELEAKYLEVRNESHMHNVPKGSEKHFNVIIVSDKFAGVPALTRHRMVFNVLKEEKKEVHALSLHPYTPEEWSKCDQATASSPMPNCLGGFGK